MNVESGDFNDASRNFQKEKLFTEMVNMYPTCLVLLAGLQN